LIFAEKADSGILRNRSSGLVDLLFADEDAAGKNEGAGTLAAGDKAALDEKQIEARFLGVRF
jgi:hypothetical protein